MRAKKDVNVQIGANIQLAREQAGYTQDELSELIGITPNHLSAIERGISGITLENLQKLCRLLGVSADYIVFGEVKCNEESVIARQLASVDPKYKKQIKKALAALLELSSMK